MSANIDTIIGVSGEIGGSNINNEEQQILQMAEQIKQKQKLIANQERNRRTCELTKKCVISTLNKKSQSIQQKIEKLTEQLEQAKQCLVTNNSNICYLENIFQTPEFDSIDNECLHSYVLVSPFMNNDDEFYRCKHCGENYDDLYDTALSKPKLVLDNFNNKNLYTNGEHIQFSAVYQRIQNITTLP